MRKFLVVGSAVVALLGALVLVAQAAGPGFGPWMRAAAAGPGGVPWPAMGPGRGPRVGGGQTIPADVWTAIQTATFSGVAKALGMTPDALRQEVTSGKTIVAIAAAKNVSLADVQTAAANARRAAVNQALSAGKLTQDQANWLLRVGPARGFGFGPGAGPRFGFRPPFMRDPAGNFQPGPPR